MIHYQDCLATAPLPSLLPTHPTLPLPVHPTTCNEDICGICNKGVHTDHKAIMCNCCNKWIHIECNKMSVIQYEHHQINPEEDFFCKKCCKCKICHKTIAKNHKKLKCNVCEELLHIKCNKLSPCDFKNMNNDEQKMFFVLSAQQTFSLSQI